MRSVRSLAVGLSLLSTATAQTSTSCDPTKKTCPSDVGLNQASYSVDFTKGASSDWNMTYGSVLYDGTNGANFTISKSGDAPTMQSNFYVFFGEISVVMKTAPGTGIVSSAILESDDLDEIDWEFLGGEATNVQTNYFGKGNTSVPTAQEREVDATISDSQAEFHNYTLVWTKDQTVFYVDGAAVRTLTYAEAVGGTKYPQTPMRVKLGIWAGGDSGNAAGTIAWAGGETDYSQGPFTAFIQSVSIVNYNPASSYTYGDLTGSYSSIELDSSDATTGSTGSSSSSNETSGTGSSSPTNSGGVFATGSASGTGPKATGFTYSNATTTSSSAPTSTASSAVVTAGAAAWGPNVLAASVVLGALSLALTLA